MNYSNFGLGGIPDLNQYSGWGTNYGATVQTPTSQQYSVGLSNSYSPLSNIASGSNIKTSVGGSGSDIGFGWNIPTFQLALGGLGALSSLWGANKQFKLANKQLSQAEKWARMNYDNQVKSYNTKLDSVLNSRGAYHGQTEEQIKKEYDKHKLT